MKAPFGLSRKNPAQSIALLSAAVRLMCGVLARDFCATLTFELAALEKADQLAVFADDGDRSDTVNLHQFAGVFESRVWFDEEPRRDRPHHVARAREMP